MISRLQELWRSIKLFLRKAGAYLRKHRRAVLVVVIVALALIGWAVYASWAHLVWADWTGLGDYTGKVDKDNRGKTLWDWLELLIIPFVLALGAWWLQRSERDNDRKIAKERFELEQKLADQRRQDDQNKAKDQQQETALQDFIDKMTELLLDKDHPLRESQPEDEVCVVARTRTLATLRGLDSARKGMLLKFLYEAELIGIGILKNAGDGLKESGGVKHPIIIMNGADLDGAVLIGADLIGVGLAQTNLHAADLSNTSLADANLNWTNLSRAKIDDSSLIKANLSGANLNGANLSDSDLSEASLGDAKLSEVNLYGANLSGANLNGANLSGANLIGADLNGADLSGANLCGADLSLANLSGANLNGANLSKTGLYETIMPDGKEYDLSIHIIDEKGHYVSKPPEETKPAIS